MELKEKTSKSINLLSILALYFAATGKAGEFSAVQTLAQDLNISITELLTIIAGVTGAVTMPVITAGSIAKQSIRIAKKLGSAIGRLF